MSKFSPWSDTEARISAWRRPGIQTETPSDTHTETALPQVDAPAPVRPDACPVEDWLAFLGHRWNALILWHLRGQPLRHQALMAQLPRITAKVLGERLSALQARGLVQQEEGASAVRHYRLTERGQALLLVLDALQWWADAGGTALDRG